MSTSSGALATKLIRYSFAIIGVLILAMILLAIASATVWKEGDIGEEYRLVLDKIMTGILPLFGAWVGAIIAFYFGRDNYDAAARNVRQAIVATGGAPLESIYVKSVMVPANKLVTAAMPAEENTELQSGIMPRLEQRGLGRLVIVDGAAMPDHAPAAGAVAKGVVHDSVINRFIANQMGQNVDKAKITLGSLLADADVARLLSAAVVYVTPEATLADVRRKMDEASRDAPATVRDALVTATGKAGEPLLGYVTDINLAEQGALK